MATIPQPPGIDDSWTQPLSDYNTKYPYNNVTCTKSGHAFEMDDTPGAERVRLHHRLGTFLEINADGSENHKIMGDGYEIVVGNKKVSISGQCHVTIKGDSVVTVEGDKYEKILGNVYTEIQGDKIETIFGSSELIANDIMAKVSGSLGDYQILAQGGLVVKGDLQVSGRTSTKTFNCSASATIANDDKVPTAGLFVGAGGIQTLGGLAVGLPTPQSPGMVTALVSVTAPFITGLALVKGLQVADVQGTMSMIRMQHNLHNHMAPLGPTSPPLKPMI